MHNSIKLGTPCELINLNPVNPLISKCQIKVCYVGDEPNRNKSVITKEVATELANSLPGSPIVGYYNETSGDFEEHNRIINLSNGKFEMKDTTRPYGFVDLNAKAWFQKFSDDGVEHEYLMTEGWLWTGQYPECKRVIEKGNNQSMELDEKIIDAYWTKDANGKREFFIINEAIISKLCILGEDVEPCFEGAQISKVQFSFEDSFKEQLFSMVKEITEMLKEGGTPKMITYAVEIGDSLWSALWSHLDEAYPDTECEYCSMYRIEGIYEEEGQKFAILQDRKDMKYYRLNFDLTEENGFVAETELTEVSKDFVPAETAQFDADAVEAYAQEYAAAKKETKTEEDEEDDNQDICPECGKPMDECECGKEDDEEDKKKSYSLEEIPEYVELQDKYSNLETSYNDLMATQETLKAEIEELTSFKAAVVKERKEAMIKSFYMLTDEDKADVIDNIDTYSLDEIEAKLSILCVRNKVSFSLDGDNKNQDPVIFNFEDTGAASNNAPDWVKALQAVAKK